MEIKRLDTSSFLLNDERVIYKTSLKQGKREIIELISCFALWLITLMCDCAIIGATYTIKNEVKNLDRYYIIIFIVSLVLHIIPFTFWVISILKRKSEKTNKWCVFSDRRLFVVSETLPKNIFILDYDDITSYVILKKGARFYMGEERFTVSGVCDMDKFIAAIEKAILKEDNLSLNSSDAIIDDEMQSTADNKELSDKE